MKTFLSWPLIIAIAAMDSAALSLETSSLARGEITATETEPQKKDSASDFPRCDSKDGQIVCPQ